MALILNIETSTKSCSVSLAENGKLIALCESVEEAYSHSRLLTVYIGQLFETTNFTVKDLDAVAVSKGPGSYTGLRIGVSAAKGIAYGLGVPLISSDTLLSMANAQSLGRVGEVAFFCPMIDARRLEVYAAIFDADNTCCRKTQADIIEQNSYSKFLDRGKVYFFGDGADKCKAILTHKNAVFIENIFPSAKDMVGLTFDKFAKQEFEDVAYFEPFYLKDFVASVPTKNIFS